ncbi:hypothetical protein CROQUDRAFT_674563 [Cronartium quercuum f. sp. fusiforme G11]|uniref:Uncharacterized protein n=1 Tax=Cronartium quercuum f. sp. fusiforme G11 TaxID=708437 RepID=A0A9P6NB45_9BASI|nr:hypothetical protein CROQUDRAFT_674563 [Cronartium quercuum f. sp. fusiforme G11]
MPWFTPNLKKSSSSPLSPSESYPNDHHPINNPPPPASARKIMEQGWYNSIKPKALPNPHSAPQSSPLTFAAPPMGVADSPLRTPARQPSSNSSLPFLRSQKSRLTLASASSRQPTTPTNAEDLRISTNAKFATLNKKNLKQHNDTITIINDVDPQVSSPRLPSGIGTLPEPTDERSHFQNSVRSLSGSTNSNSKWHSSPLLAQHSQPSLLIHQTQAPSSAAHEFEVATQSLAIRLQELATANQDGLLDDEEYRVLRQGLFDRMTANNNQPSVIEIDPVHHESFPNTASTLPSTHNEQPSMSPQLIGPATCLAPLSPTRPAPSIRRSLRSTTSTTSFIHSLFKRQTRWLRPKTASSDNDDKSLSDEPHSAPPFTLLPADPPPLLTRTLHHRPEIHGQAPVPIQPPPPVNQGGCSQSMTSSISAPSETSSISARPKQTNFNRSSSTYSKSSRMLSGTTLTTTVVATADQLHTSATAIRREISDLEYERGRVLETFDEMERAAIMRWRGHEGTSASSEVVVGSTRGRPQSFLAPLPSAATLRTGSRHQHPRGTFKNPAVTNGEMHGVSEESGETSELEKELEEIKKKRKAVEDRYGDRLEYLNAKLKGAMLRERTNAR